MSPPYSLQSLLTACSTVGEHLHFEQCLIYIDLIQLLKPTLSLSLLPEEEGPLSLGRLPRNIHAFLCKCLNLDHENAKIVWEVLSPVAWTRHINPNDMHTFGQQYLQLFLDHGPSLGIAFYHFLPPVTTCLDPNCSPKRQGKVSGGNFTGRRLAEELTINVTVFTQNVGPIPALSTSKYCRECNTRYHPNYWVSNASAKDSERVYYLNHSVLFLHIAQHVFIEVRTLELFTSMMLNSWTSAGNCARIYNDAITVDHSLPAVYSKGFTLDGENVWNALLLHWLLEDAGERNEALHITHNAPSQAKRLQSALAARNDRMAGPGQEAWSHVCDLCCWFNTLPDGQTTFIRSTVTDGITIGRPTCSVHDCDEPLESPKNRYCRTHKDEANICAVTTCRNNIESGHRTCGSQEHRKLEEYNALHNKAMFQLKHRLAKLKTSQPTDSIPESSEPCANTFDDEEVHIDQDGVCDDEEPEVDILNKNKDKICKGKPETGNKSLRARFGRKRTHNEQLCVASCGVILGRATFYGSEAPNGVREFWETLFPTKRSIPAILWHDNNCRISAMLRKENNTYFAASALPVDVFHFKSKHKVTDTDCNAFCNPARWPELYTPDGQWRFNSSAAEQANAWIGGYQSILREMEAERYEFFLDEMIKRRNRNLIKGLEKKGKYPFNIPREDLLGPETENDIIASV